MKTFFLSALVLVAVVAFASCDEIKDRAKEIAEGCRKENGVPEEDAMKIRQGKLAAADVKDNMKCSMNCFMVKMGFMNDAGKFNADAYKQMFTKHEAKDQIMAAMEKCKGLEGANPCETAFKISSCLMQEKVHEME